MCCLNSSFVDCDKLMSLNIPSSFEVNWQPHSVCKQIENLKYKANKYNERLEHLPLPYEKARETTNL